MKSDLESVLSQIRKGEAPPLLLLHGDDFCVREACRALLDLLVSSENRAFNLEQFDGRSASWDEIEAALLTPSFLGGRKVVYVDSAPYFLSRERKQEVGERIFQLWVEGRKEEAASLFMDLLLVEGWTEEMWDALQGPLSGPQVVGLFGAGGNEVKEEVEGLVAFCRSLGLGLAGRKGGEGSRLMELLDRGLPSWGFLLLTAPHVDRRTRLYRKFEERGAALDLGLERDRSGRISRERVAEFVDRRLREAGKRVEPEAREMILLRAGEQLWSVHQELEKLLFYVGEDPRIRVKDVEEAFLDQGEAWVFDLTQAIARRDSVAALEHLARLMSQGDHPLKLLAIIAGEVRRLLVARQLIEGEMRHCWSPEMSFPQFQRGVLQQGQPLVTRSPYGDYMSFQRAENFTTGELALYLRWIYETDLRLKTTGSSPRMVMERFILEMCQPMGNAK